MQSTTLIAFDQHAATTVAAVLGPGQRTPALQWRLDYVYACFPLFMGAAALRFLSHAVLLCLRRS